MCPVFIYTEKLVKYSQNQGFNQGQVLSLHSSHPDTGLSNNYISSKKHLSQVKEETMTPVIPKSTGVSLPEQQHLGMKTQLDQVSAGSTPFSVLLT